MPARKECSPRLFTTNRIGWKWGHIAKCRTIYLGVIKRYLQCLLILFRWQGLEVLNSGKLAVPKGDKICQRSNNGSANEQSLSRAMALSRWPARSLSVFLCCCWTSLVFTTSGSARAVHVHRPVPASDWIEYQMRPSDLHVYRLCREANAHADWPAQRP